MTKEIVENGLKIGDNGIVDIDEVIKLGFLHFRLRLT